MYSTVCLFPWFPKGYNFRAAVMKVFGISAEQLVRLRIHSANNIVIFTVASEDVFDHVSELYFRTLYFPILGLNVLECIAYPKSPQFQFFRMSAFPAKGMKHTVSGLGAVLYKRRMSNKVPTMLGFRKDSIGVVLLINDESNNSAEAGSAPPTNQGPRGNDQDGQADAGPAPQEPVAGPSSAPAGNSAADLQQLFSIPACPVHSGFPNQNQGPKIRTFQTPRVLPNSRKVKRRRFGRRIQFSMMGQLSPVTEERVAQGPPSEDEGPSGNPTAEDQNPKASDEDKEE